MNIETISKPPEEIQGIIINVSFPRSGHRFLREILSGYFEDRFVFYESYAKKVLSKSEHVTRLKNVNYVKTHDFQLLGNKVLFFKFPRNRRYLVQIRHPLESIASYYEFALKHMKVESDTEETWNAFLLKNLAYWKQFNEVWLARKQADSLLITYDNLYANTFKSAETAIKFLTGKPSVNAGRLTRVIDEQQFLQYVDDENSRKQKKRQLRTFKYYNAARFKKIENTLVEDYLQPYGIKLLLQ